MWVLGSLAYAVFETVGFRSAQAFFAHIFPTAISQHPRFIFLCLFAVILGSILGFLLRQPNELLWLAAFSVVLFCWVVLFERSLMSAPLSVDAPLIAISLLSLLPATLAFASGFIVLHPWHP